MAAKTIHLKGRYGRMDETACGKFIAKRVVRRGSLYAGPSFEDRKEPLTVTADFGEVTCGQCQNSHPYQSEMRTRKHIRIEREKEDRNARRNRKFALTVTVDVMAIDADDAAMQALRLFAGTGLKVLVSDYGTKDGNFVEARTYDRPDRSGVKFADASEGSDR